MATIHVPAMVSALAFVGLALLMWRRFPLAARVALASGTTVAIAAVKHPGMSVEDILRQTRDGMTYMVGFARISGTVAVLLAGALFLRSRSEPH